MRVISRKRLKEFWERHRDAEQPLKAWYAEVARAQWMGPGDIKARYPSASILANDRVVFNIKGNRYRLIVIVRYKACIVFVRFIGTHPEYDGIDAAQV